MARVDLVLHNGSRIVDRRQLKNEFRGMTIMDVTKASYRVGTQYYENMGAEELTAINGLKKGKDSGLQLYIALEKGGTVMEMGLPLIHDSSGKERFLNAANLKIGDIEGLTSHLPEDAKILLVWRLDRDMTQDITLSGDSIVSRVGHESGMDYSLLDKKVSAGCGGGTADKISLVADILEVKLFCGDRDNPIGMATLMVPPPQAFAFDSFSSLHPPLALIPQPLLPEQAVARERMAVQTLADFAARTSWSSEAFQLLLQQPAPSFFQPHGLTPESVPQESRKAQIQEDLRPQACQFETPADNLPAMLNQAEKRLWEILYKDDLGPGDAPPPSAAAMTLPLPVRALGSAMGARLPSPGTRQNPISKTRNPEPQGRAATEIETRRAAKPSRPPTQSSGPACAVKSQKAGFAQPAGMEKPRRIAPQHMRAPLAESRRAGKANAAPAIAEMAKQKTRHPPRAIHAPQLGFAGLHVPSRPKTAPAQSRPENMAPGNMAQNKPEAQGKAMAKRKAGATAGIKTEEKKRPKPPGMKTYFLMGMLGLYPAKPSGRGKRLSGRAAARS